MIRYRFTKEVEDDIIKLRKKLNKLSLEEIHWAVAEMGYKNINSGQFKRVYKKPRDNNYCIKVYKDLWGWKEDGYNVPEDIKEYYLHPIYANKKFIIQPLAKRSGRAIKKLPEKVKKLWQYDIYRQNIMVYDDREVIIDFCNHAVK